MSVPQQVFKLLVEVRDYGLSVKQCMELRCISSWARDQVIRKQLSLRRHVINNLIGNVRVDFDGGRDFVDVITSFRQGNPPLFVCSDLICEFSKEFFEIMAADDALFFLFWKHLESGAESNVCKGCLINVRKKVQPSLTSSLPNYPLMCLKCWQRQIGICVWIKNNQYRYKLHPYYIGFQIDDYHYFTTLLEESTDDFIYINDNLLYEDDEDDLPYYGDRKKEGYIFFQKFLHDNGYYDEDDDKRDEDFGVKKRKKLRTKN